jgi:hypothetical protein
MLFSAFSQRQKTTIHLTPDAGFRTKIDWGYYFPTGFDQMIGFLENGSFFMASPQRNSVLHISATGELLSEFGRPGQGPGDLTFPRDVSILDGRYVVVNESGETRRISIFNLKGEFFKLIQTDLPHLSCVSVGGGKIAVVTGQLNKNIRKDIVSLKDIHSGQAINIDSFEYEIAIRSRIRIASLSPSVHLARTDGNKLLVGFSGNDCLSIYSQEGKKLASYSLNIPTRKIKRGEIESYLMKQAEAEKNENRRMLMKKMFRENIGNIPLPDFYPVYYKLTVDSNNTILVYDNAWLDGSPVSYRAYSATGDYVGETQIEENEYQPVYPQNFFGDWLYVLLRKKVDNENILLARISLR